VIKSITENHLGHIQIVRQEYPENKQLHYSFDWTQGEALKKAVPPASRIVERVPFPAVISTGERPAQIWQLGMRHGALLPRAVRSSS
jgi:hypothetical protein